MSDLTQLMCGITLITIPSIQYGGYFLLQVLSGNPKTPELNDFQKAMFRAGHAHAGVLIILSLITQMLVDYASLGTALAWLVRVGVPLSAMLISGGFFGSAVGKGRTRPNALVGLVYAGAGLLALSLVVLGVGLVMGVS